MEFENKDLCAKCGGICCKKSGCDYFVKDFDSLSTEAILKILDSGKVSVIANLNFEKTKNGKIMVNPLLYLRARNINREIIDLFSMKTSCSLLTDTGCSYNIDERPSGGLNLIPSEEGCYHFEDHRKMIEQWYSYQKPLSKVVKILTGKTVDEKLKEDIENTYFDLFSGNVKDVSINELRDIKSCIPFLMSVYPEIFAKIIKRKEEQKIKRLK